MQSDLYRAVWRWHFYAGLIVLPFLLWLAVTGGTYLFKPEIERLVYRDWMELSSARLPMDASTMVSSVERQLGGEVTQVERPAATSKSWRMRVETTAGARTVFVDPAAGLVLGVVREGGVMKLVRDLHSLAITGPIGNALIEITAGWAIILTLTGFYLWWPRNGQPAIALRRPMHRRRFWRDLHASTGVVGGAIVLFLAITGMPWSVVWGKQVQRMVAEQGWGRATAPGPQPWEHGGHERRHDAAAHARAATLPWSLQERPEPAASIKPDSIGVSGALRLADRLGMRGELTVSLPRKAGQPFSISCKVVASSDARAIYIDPSSGRVLQDARYADFGSGAKIIEWGIATHQGQEYGEVNRWIMLVGCISIIILAVSAPVLWWKRRVGNRLRLPPNPLDMAKVRTVALLIGVGGLIFPLTGMTFAVAALLDWRIRKRVTG